jgi:hypothetical protein
MSSLPPPAWAPDPFGRYQLRWWNGALWTEHVAFGGQQSIDPPVASPPSALIAPASPRLPKRERGKLKGERHELDPRRPQTFELEGANKVEVHVAGTSYQQSELLALAGGKRGNRGVNLRCLAELWPEPTNAYDPNAVAVRIDGHQVGWLPRAAAAPVAAALGRLRGAGLVYGVTAMIVGGWDNGDGDTGYFGVRVFLASPAELEEAAQ